MTERQANILIWIQPKTICSVYGEKTQQVLTCCIEAGQLTQQERRLAQLELVVVMAAMFRAVRRGGRRLPHQQIVIDPSGEQWEKIIHVNSDTRFRTNTETKNRGLTKKK